MRLLSHTYWRGSWVRFREPMAAVEALARCRLVTVNASDGAQSRGLYWTPRAHPRPRVAVVAAHPRVDFSQHYLFPHLLRAGYACLGANLRSLNNDVSCVHEQLLLDLAAHLRWLQAERGIERIVWLGNSGGGSLGCFYQHQAAAAPADRLTHTPAGRPVRLGAEDMPAFSAMLVLAAHTGQGAVLMETIDPAVIDEADPLRSDSAPKVRVCARPERSSRGSSTPSSSRAAVCSPKRPCTRATADRALRTTSSTSASGTASPPMCSHTSQRPQPCRVSASSPK
jgi:hypothetical protein